MGVVVGPISLGRHEELLRLAHSGSSKTEVIVALLGVEFWASEAERNRREHVFATTNSISWLLIAFNNSL